MSPKNINCLLCKGKAKIITSILNQCLSCDLVFKNPEIFVSVQDEKKRYETHNNDLEDSGYLQYLNKGFSKIQDPKSVILDFGCGPSKGLGALIEKKGLNLEVESYDPIFFPELKREKYTTIFASECFEHFCFPDKSIKKVMSLLDRVVNGQIYVGTVLHSKSTDWESWWYLKDFTHVVFYSRKTFEWIAAEHDLRIESLGENFGVFTA